MTQLLAHKTNSTLKILFLFCLSLTISISAYGGNTNDRCQLRVIYTAFGRLKYEKGFNQIKKSDYELLIGNSISKFNNVWHDKCQEYMDSLNTTAGMNAIFEYRNSAFPSRMGIDYILYKNHPDESLIRFKGNIGTFDFFYEEPIPEINWTFCDGDTTIVGYACKKAVAEHRGRTWTAWYALDLPYDNGPWKLQGLPGLILYAKESKGEFAFECKGIEKGNDAPIKTDNHKAEKVTGKQYNELLKECEYDTSRFVTRHLNLGFKDEPTDTTIQKRFTPCLMEYY